MSIDSEKKRKKHRGFELDLDRNYFVNCCCLSAHTHAIENEIEKMIYDMPKIKSEHIQNILFLVH